MDGIHLWLAALRNSPSPPSQPLKYYDLLDKLVSMLSQNFDLLGSITELLESYYVSNATFVLQVWVTTSIFMAAYRVTGFSAMRGSIVHGLQAPLDSKYHSQRQGTRQLRRFGDRAGPFCSLGRAATRLRAV